MISRILAALTLTALTLAAAAQPTPSAEKQRMIDLGIEHGTARALYDHLKQEAGGGEASGKAGMLGSGEFCTNVMKPSCV